MPKASAKSIYQLRVSLRDCERPIWRRIQVWDDTPLPHLHRILQLIMNWEDYHVHDFIIGGRVFSVPDPEDVDFDRKVEDERKVKLRNVIASVGDCFEYLYDLGDDWYHDILLEAILLPEPGTEYPRCIAGERNAPPEDAGGPFGYADYQEALADPDHPNHEEMMQWRGKWDFERFSLSKINARLTQAFRPRSMKAGASKHKVQ